MGLVWAQRRHSAPFPARTAPPRRAEPAAPATGMCAFCCARRVGQGRAAAVLVGREVGGRGLGGGVGWSLAGWARKRRFTSWKGP